MTSNYKSLLLRKSRKLQPSENRVNVEKQRALERLQDSVWEWLVIQNIEIDTHFYNIQKWKERGEDYHNDAELVLVFEGSLHTILNFGGDTEVFDDLVESFGFFYELGHSWNMGFYPLDNYRFSESNATYAEKLRDPRWKQKSKKVKNRAENKCQDCSSSNRLEAHHSYYKKHGRQYYESWEYPLDSFRCLCRNCHENRHKEEIRIRSYLAALSTEDLAKTRSALDNSSYWIGLQSTFDVLENIKNSKQKFIKYIEGIKFEDT